MYQDPSDNPNRIDKFTFERPRYIVIEGPVGVGKSNLIKRLADTFECLTMFDAEENNPFLASFYRDHEKYGFQTQVFFLLCRYRQQQQLLQPDLFQRTVFSNYIFAKDRLYASINLSENELLLYDQIYQTLDTRVAKPDLVVYLQARLEVLQSRIELRARPFERNFDEQYLKNICAVYSDYFFHYIESPLLVVDTSDIDVDGSDDDFYDLAQNILRHRGGVQFYKPLGRRDR